MATEAVAQSVVLAEGIAVSDLDHHFQTVAEFEEWLKEQYELTDKRFEFFNGQIIEKPGMKQDEFDIVDFLLRLFSRTAAYKNKDSLLPEADSYVDAKRKRIPDVAYFTAEQRKDIRAGKKVAASFAIEILSESETVGHFQRKIQDYFEADAKLVWYIMPLAQQIYAYTSPMDVKIYGGKQEISAAPVLEDFRFKVEDLFVQPQ